MASNNYSPYNQPYQQSSAIQYSAYQTAPAASNVAQSRQYQQPSTTQAQDYTHYPAQPYSGQGSDYEAPQDNSWNTNNYAGTRETTSRAAEVLHSMSNTAYTPNSAPGTNQTNFTVANAVGQSHSYAGSSYSPQLQAQHHASYGQTQARPRSVNTNRAQVTASRGLPSPTTTGAYPSQRTQMLYNQQQRQRSASPAQHQYNTTPASSARNAAVTATVDQYHDYNARQLPGVEASRSAQNAIGLASYNYATTQTSSAPTTVAALGTSASDMYSGQSTTTVDPTAVYDPWPEYQRKQEVLRAQKAIEDAAREEEQRKAEDHRKEQERKRKEEEERSQPQPPKQKTKKSQKQRANVSETLEAESELSANPDDFLEAEIRAMMAKMREYNSKDPALLARIWEEERKAKAPKSPLTQNGPIPNVTSSQMAPVAQASTSQVVKLNKAVAKEPLKRTPVKLPAPPAAQAVAAKTPIPVTKTSGNTIWPAEKKTQLANAAVTFLKIQNPNHVLQASEILGMLDSNPSYIELCEQLERIGLKLDRAAFARSLLTAVPDINSGSQRPTTQPPAAAIQRPQAPPAFMKKEVATPTAASPPYAPATASSVITPAPVAEMVPIKVELKPPANKEEAARKRKLSDLVDLTLLSDEEDYRPQSKKLNVDAMYSIGAPHPHIDDAMIVDKEPAIQNFPIAASRPSQPPAASIALPVQPPAELRRKDYVDHLDKKKALRRNTYNPATIARDVLLACGRHPSERQLNQHLEVLRTTLPQISFDSDLSTIKWDIIDPGKPPPGYFKDSFQAMAGDADDEDDSDDENREIRPRALSHTIGGEGGAQARVQALPEGINPFKQKKRGRPPRHSLPGDRTSTTPKRPPASTSMSVNGPQSASPAGGLGYRAFRSVTEYGPDGQPLPKKKGRPVGWRKAIHGSAASQTRPSPNGHTGPLKHQPSQPSSLRNIKVGEGGEPIHIDSRSPSVATRVPQYQSYKCKWHNCQAELHNLETLRKHVFKVHRKETAQNTLECLWDDCGKEVTHFDPLTNMRIERHEPHAFDLQSFWQAHIQQHHFDPLSWKLGDGPVGGTSDSHDSETYLSDAQGRQVTPRIVVDPERLQAHYTSSDILAPVRKGRGRPSKNEDDPHETYARLVSHKKRIGGPGMDRGGATLVNDKRRKGLNDGDGTEEELVDLED